MKKKSRLKVFLLSAGLAVSLVGSLPVYSTENIPDESAAGEVFSQDTAAGETAPADTGNTEFQDTVVDETLPDNTASEDTADSVAASDNTDAGQAASGDTADSGTAAAANAVWPAGPEISSEAAILMDDATGTILYSKNPDTSMQTGSPVKIMTVLVALENASLTDTVTVTETGASGVSSESANISLTVGEVLTLEDCLHGIMLASANDAALQVAEQVSGSVDAFVEKMNQRAAELGCTNTHFSNPTGLSDEAQVTTAHDLALITKAALDNEQFRKISSADQYTIPATDYQDARVLSNNFALFQSQSSYYYEGCVGGKEGYTEESLSTLACGAEKNNTLLIAVVLKGENDATDADAVSLLDFGFSNFETIQVEPEAVQGGTAMVPIGTSASQLNILSSEKTDGTHQQYYFADNAVGSGLVQITVHETSIDPEKAAQAEVHLKAASDLSLNKSMNPYYIIAGVTGGLLLILLIMLIKVIRS